MPAAASNSLGGRFWGKLAVFWRFAKNTRALLSIPACSSYSLLFALIFAWIFTVLSFFDPVRACAFCPNKCLLLCATCTLIGWKHIRKGPAGRSFQGQAGSGSGPSRKPCSVRYQQEEKPQSSKRVLARPKPVSRAPAAWLSPVMHTRAFLRRISFNKKAAG